LDNGENRYAELASFNGYLYAWTSNFATGQQVLRTACPIVEIAAASEGTKTLDFPGIGAAITLTVGSSSTVMANLYPGANLYPPAAPGLRVVRTYTFTSLTADTFAEDLALTYDPDVVALYRVTPASLYLARWDGRVWMPCAAGTIHDPARRTLICRGITDLGVWGVVGMRLRLFLPLVRRLD
jgi:hypothetical protein